MTDHGLLLKGENVLATQAGRKTQTRRIVSCHNTYVDGRRVHQKWWERLGLKDARINKQGALFAPRCPAPEEGDYQGTEMVKWHHLTPIYQPGDRIWFRETWASKQKYIVAYRADGACGAWMGDGDGGSLWMHHGWIVKLSNEPGRYFGLDAFGGKWRPSIFMPKWACRLWREVIHTVPERVQDISWRDALAEGLIPCSETYGATKGNQEQCVKDFAGLWDSINGKKDGRAWKDNPWCWAISYKEPVQ